MERALLDDSFSDLTLNLRYGARTTSCSNKKYTPYYYYPLEVSEKIDSSTVGQYQLDSQGKFTKIAEWEFRKRFEWKLKLEENKIFSDHTFLQWADMAEAG